ncbi:hypothetical protein K439DRAFT_1649960 [Ramaria rubella]|nr:hypothetical protein K439DRAFT_1649960 [Ramaria rubella]
MVSDFLTPDEAHIVFKAGKSQDGWFTAEDLLKQIETVVDIFESKTKGTATGLFMFDNASSHQKQAADALSAHKMPKGPHATWTHHKVGPRMHCGMFSNGMAYHFYYPDNHPTMPSCTLDFSSQKSQLEEYITSRGHICDFYPKYHCELNFIEQYWGAAKLRYRSSPQTADIEQMEKNMLACLDDVPHLQILRYANCSA